ncbi:hypothetical protein OUZ56_033168 [Daphnia magna]|uniref:DEAD/DEAH box helicase n=1 Tax=Daphnia magna TaxID=35525 RepID=A0ABR0BAD3_9CRUS|nr:hypothetical protein OUZ56_033168 [Daphnia magna]
MQFSDFALSEPILRAVHRHWEDGRLRPPDPERLLLAKAKREDVSLAGKPAGRGDAAPGRRKLRVLVLSPTRELAAQIHESFETYGKFTGFRSAVVFGGVNINRQITELGRGVDILVATPGRLLDLLGQRALTLSDLTVFVLDEADRMLDMGFIHDVRKIAALVPKVRQTLFFSATMPDDIRALSKNILTNPVEVAVTPVASTAETIDQRMYFVEKADKRHLLVSVLKDENIERALVFTRTKHGANRVVEHLEKLGITAAAIHGNKSQNARERALDGFKASQIRVLVATDIAARGIDIDGLAFVVNYELPNIPESYVHRIGRTGRAGASGRAISFCEAEERPYLRDIEKLIRRKIDVIAEHPYPSPLGIPSGIPGSDRRAAEAFARTAAASDPDARPPREFGGRGRGGNQGRSGTGPRPGARSGVGGRPEARPIGGRPIAAAPAGSPARPARPNGASPNVPVAPGARPVTSNHPRGHRGGGGPRGPSAR